MDTTQHWQYVGFWKRFLASIVDTIILLALTSPLMYLAYGAVFWSDPMAIRGLADVVINWLAPIVLIIWLWHRFGATPGKMMLGAKIVDATTGEEPSIGQLVGRYFGYIVSTLPLCLGFLWVAIDARKQGWHDKLAGTVVVAPVRDAPQGFQPRL